MAQAETDVRSPWFDSKDWPVAHTHSGPPNQWPQTFASESGLRIVLDLDRGGERCLARKPYLMGEVICFMPRGHDTPHMPMSVELVEQTGPLIVREIGHGTGGRRST